MLPLNLVLICWFGTVTAGVCVRRTGAPGLSRTIREFSALYAPSMITFEGYAEECDMSLRSTRVVSVLAAVVATAVGGACSSTPPGKGSGTNENVGPTGVCQLEGISAVWSGNLGGLPTGSLIVRLFLTFCASGQDVQVTAGRLDGTPLTFTEQWFCGCTGAGSSCINTPESICTSGQPVVAAFAEVPSTSASELQLDLTLHGQAETVGVDKGQNHPFEDTCSGATEATCTQ